MKIEMMTSEGEMHEDGFFNVLLHTLFPDSEDERKIALGILRFERERYLAQGSGYEPTGITKAVVEKVSKQSAQRYVTGLVGLAIVAESYAQGNCSLNKAYEITSEYCLTYPRLAFWDPLSNTQKTQEMNLRTDPTSIRKAFLAHRRYAHICVANVVASEYSQPKSIFDRAFEYEAAFIQTCAFFQQHLEQQPGATEWGLFDLISTRPDSVAGFPAMTPSDAAHIHFISPYLQNQIAKGAIIGP